MVIVTVTGERFDAYEEYLKSDWWKARKRIIFKYRDIFCQGCGKEFKTGRDGNTLIGAEVHHTSYAHLGDEWAEDLLVLCRDCHKEEHRK